SRHRKYPANLVIGAAAIRDDRTNGRLFVIRPPHAAQTHLEHHAIFLVASGSTPLVQFGDQPHHVQAQPEVWCTGLRARAAYADQRVEQLPLHGIGKCGPRLATTMRASPSSPACSAIRIQPSGPVNDSALSKSLSSACAINSGAPYSGTGPAGISHSSSR